MGHPARSVPFFLHALSQSVGLLHRKPLLSGDCLPPLARTNTLASVRIFGTLNRSTCTPHLRINLAGLRTAQYTIQPRMTEQEGRLAIILGHLRNGSEFLFRMEGQAG